MEIISRTIKNEDGIVKEELLVNDSKIHKITFSYEGTESNLDNFLKQLIVSKLRKDRLID